MQPFEMTSPVEIQHRNAGFMEGEVYYPALHSQFDHQPLQKRERKLIIITDPDDSSRDMMAELFRMKMSSLCSITVEAPVPPKTTPSMEGEPNTSVPASETQSQKKTREPVIFFIPLTEEEHEEAKKADITFGDSSFDHQTLTGGDIVEAPTPLQVTPPKVLHKRPGLLLFSIPPEEEVKQKMEKAQMKKTREAVIFFIPLTGEIEEQVKKANIMFGDFLFEYQTLTEVDIVEAPAPLETTFTKDVEPNTADTTPEPAPLEVQPSEPHPAASPSVPSERKKYDRESLLHLQFVSFCMRRPEGLPIIPGVILDECEFKKARKIISIPLNNDVTLNKAEKAWKPAAKKSLGVEDDQEMVKTQELFQKVRSILNKLTPQMFEQLMERFKELTIDTEERLRGVVDLIFEKAISEPSYSLIYANMCRYFVGLTVPTSDNSGATVSFCKLLLIRCQKEFEKDKGDEEIFQQKQKELDAATEEEVEQQLNKARHRSLGNIKFIGELFMQEMMKEQIMHVCIIKLLKNYNEESLEVLCKLLSTIGKKLDLEESKPHMDRYFQQIEQIVKERKTSSRIRFMMQDLLDLRKNDWVPRRGDQGPKTIDQIHKEAELEKQKELSEVQQLLQSRETPCQERQGERNAVPSRAMKQPCLTKPDAGQPATCTLNRFSVLQESGPSSTSCSSSLDKCRAPALSEEEVEKKTTPIIEEYLHINDLKEAAQCVKELNSPSVLYVFVRTAVESVLDRSAVARESMGLLLHRLVLTRILPPNQYFRGLREILEVADDMAIDIPHIWQYLAEIIAPMLHDGGIHMRLLFREVTKPLLPIGKAAVLLVHILNRLNHTEAGTLWRKARLNWKDFLPEDEDVHKFVTEQKVEFTLGRRPESST